MRTSDGTGPTLLSQRKTTRPTGYSARADVQSEFPADVVLAFRASDRRNNGRFAGWAKVSVAGPGSGPSSGRDDDPPVSILDREPQLGFPNP